MPSLMCAVSRTISVLSKPAPALGAFEAFAAERHKQERRRNKTEDVQFDDKRKEVVLKLTSTKIHGVVDGAHTLDAILEAQKQPPEDGWPAYVFVKAITGVDSDQIAEIAGGLNTSQRVDLKSLENLREHFSELQKVLAGQPYADQVAFKMNEDKPVDVREILYYLAVFDCSQYSANKHPVTLPVGRYKAGKSTRIRSESNRETQLVFTGDMVNGKIPLGWIMPMLAGFRANVDWNKPKGSFRWIMPLDELIDACIEPLVLAIRDVHEQENSRPEYVGRNSIAWRMSYNAVSQAILEWELKRARRPQR